MQQRRRLNVFAFGSETNALFGMLIITSLMLTLFLGMAFGLFFGITDSISGIDISTRGLEITNTYLPIICLSTTAVFAVFGMAVIFYLRHPSEIQRRRKISPLVEKDHDIQEHVNELAVQEGIEPPRIQMPTQGLRGTDAQAFGIGRSQMIALDGGFRILRKTKPDVFNALIHHELAHLANADVGRSYFSAALWISIRWIIVLPFVLSVVGNIIIGLFLGLYYGDLLERFMGPAQFIFRLFTQFGFILAIAALIWARLLRTREFYADWRAVLWGSQAGLNTILQEENEKERPTIRFNLWKLHPDAKDRTDAIQYPETLLKLSPEFVFLAGLLLSFMFVGLYFSFSIFLAFVGVLQSIQDSTTELSYWLFRGMFWFGFACIVLLLFGLMGWLINGVLLPQIQKQTILELINKQRGLMHYAKMGIPSLLLIAGIEFGFIMTPFGLFAPNTVMGFIVEIFIIGPVLVVTVWWYLVYIRFVNYRLLATQTGRHFSIWRRRFIRTASTIWAFLFFMPLLFWSRILDGTISNSLLYINLGLLAFTILLSLITFGTSWLIIKMFFDNQPKKCPHCGKTTQHRAPAIESCEHCGGILGEWLFIPEKP